MKEFELFSKTFITSMDEMIARQSSSISFRVSLVLRIRYPRIHRLQPSSRNYSRRELLAASLPVFSSWTSTNIANIVCKPDKSPSHAVRTFGGKQP
ncbi:hypothetical protein AX14_006848 [Amanita brunnescens Koide BX004]|nr:hypothetical protein AX14_006848 [Amanita brunnescens Koide BX004]